MNLTYTFLLWMPIGRKSHKGLPEWLLKFSYLSLLCEYKILLSHYLRHGTDVSDCKKFCACGSWSLEPYSQSFLRSVYNWSLRNHQNLWIFSKPPMLAFKQPPNLRSMLIRAKLATKSRPSRINIGTHSCGKSYAIWSFMLPVSYNIQSRTNLNIEIQTVLNSQCVSFIWENMTRSQGTI